MDDIGEVVLSNIAGTVTYLFQYYGGPHELKIKKQIAYSNGEGAPSESTYAAEVGALYVDTKTGEFYKCIKIEEDAEGKVYKWEPLVKPSSQSDWNQNDESANDFVKNRTHWTEYVTEISYDGKTSGMPIVYIEELDLSFRKLSDDYFIPEQLIGGSIEIFGNTGIIEAESIVEIEGKPACQLENIIFVNEDFDQLTKGTWMASSGPIDSGSFVPMPFVIKPNPFVPLPERKSHKIDEKFLPDASVKKTLETITLPYGALKDTTIPADGVNMNLRPEVSMIIENEKTPVFSLFIPTEFDTLNGARSFWLILGNPKLFDENSNFASSDTFCSFFSVTIEQNSISINLFEEVGDIPLDNTNFIFNYDFYSDSNLNMLPAPLYLDYDLNEAISGLLDVPQLFESLLGGR
jgi:hypothetical protein